MKSELQSFWKYLPARAVDAPRFAEESEIRRQTVELNTTDETYPIGGVPLYHQNSRILIDPSDINTLIFGSPGSMKTRLFVIPTILSIIKAGYSAIILDPKGELYRQTSGLAKRHGYEISTLNLRDPTKSHGWNPLSLAFRLLRKGEEEKAYLSVNDVADTLFPKTSKDPYWDTQSENIFRANALFLLDSGHDIPEAFCNLRSIMSFAQSIPEEGECIFFELLKNFAKNEIPWLLMKGIADAPSKTRGCILSSYSGFFNKLMLSANTLDLLCHDQIDVPGLTSRKSLIYLIVPDESAVFNHLVSLFLEQAYAQLIMKAQAQPSGKLPKPIHFICEELGNIPAIPGFASMLSAGRSRNIFFDMVFQSERQMYDVYGEDVAHVIQSDAQNWIYLSSRELPLLQTISQLCGMDDRGKPLLSVSDLQRLSKEKGEALILQGRNRPFVTHMDDVSRYPEYGMPPVPLRGMVREKTYTLNPNGLYTVITQGKRKGKIYPGHWARYCGIDLAYFYNRDNYAASNVDMEGEVRIEDIDAKVSGAAD